MTLKFNKDGYLDPGRHQSNISEIKEFFVDNFPKSKSRDSRFKGFVKYSRNICNEISCTRRQIIGGSFTTNKLNPHDIDFLIVLDDKNLTRKERRFIKLEEERKRQEKRIRDGMIEQVKAGYIDINLVPCCDNFFICHQLPKVKTYKQYLKTKKYWVNQFGKTRKNEDGKRIKRGVVDLELNSTTFEGI